MPDDKSKVGEPDRSRVAAEHGGRRMRYPSAHGSGGYAFTHSEKTQLIERFGNDREKLYAGAETLKLGQIVGLLPKRERVGWACTGLAAKSHARSQDDGYLPPGKIVRVRRLTTEEFMSDMFGFDGTGRSL